MSDPFAHTARALLDLDARIDREEKRANELEAEHAKRGDYEAVRAVASRYQSILNTLYDERIRLRQQMPPFMTYEDGFYVKHPVTEENRHLLNE